MLCSFGAVAAVSACRSDEQPPTSRQQRKVAEVVYGEDNRQEVYDYHDRQWAEAVLGFTVALFDTEDIDASNPDDIGLPSLTLQEKEDLCPEQRFADQPASAWCSGTLIASDLVLTTGHCIESDWHCANVSFVFNYAVKQAGTPATLTEDDIYGCQEILVRRFSLELDYAVVRLDREATGRLPANVRRYPAALDQGTGLSVASCPSGIPIKIDDGGWVRDNRAAELDYFLANLDTFDSSSGAGVFLADSGEMVGVMRLGEVDYVKEGSCWVVNQCSDTACSGEQVTYVYKAIEELCATLSDSELCACGDGVCGDDESSADCWPDCGTHCGDSACNGDESPADCPEDCDVDAGASDTDGSAGAAFAGDAGNTDGSAGAASAGGASNGGSDAGAPPAAGASDGGVTGKDGAEDAGSDPEPGDDELSDAEPSDASVCEPGTVRSDGACVSSAENPVSGGCSCETAGATSGRVGSDSLFILGILVLVFFRRR